MYHWENYSTSPIAATAGETPVSSSPPSTAAAATGRNWFGQPPGLTVLFLTETWERFSFYGMSALLIYYMTKQLQFSQADASLIFGLYSGGVFLTPILGGWIADRWLGKRRAILIGGTLMALGHFALAWESQFYPGLALICLGNGLFLPNLPSQIGELYAEDDPRRGGAYNVYYVGVNLGGLLAPLVCGTLGEVYGWHWGFGAAGLGMCLGLGIYVLGRRHLPAERPIRRVIEKSVKPALQTSAFVPLLLVGLLVLLFRSAYAQSGNTLALWVDSAVDLQLFTYRHMHGFGSHAFSMINSAGGRTWVKFHLVCQQKIATLTDAEAAALVAKDRESHQRDLFDAIERKDFPAGRCASRS